MSSRPRLLRRLDAEHHVLGDGEDGHQHEVLVHHADAGGDGVGRASERDRLAVDQDLALVGSYRPKRTFMSVDLPAPFSPSKAWTSPLFDGEVHVLVGDDAGEPLGDAPQLDLHRQRRTASVPRA